MNKTVQVKKRLPIRNFISTKYNSSEKSISQKHNSFTNNFNKNAKSLKDYINVNNPYMPIWLSKIILNNNNLVKYGPKYLMEKFNHKNDFLSKTKNVFHPMKNRTLDLGDKVKRKYLINDYPIISQKKSIPEKKNFRKAESMVNLINTKNINLFNHKKEKEKNHDKENDNYKIEDDIPINKEKEKQFYQMQKNFFKMRKEIIEEPEYLEEDS